MWLLTNDIFLETLRAAILAALDIYLLRVGRSRGFSSSPGWKLVQWGFHLLLFGTVIDVTDNFPSLNSFVIIGHTPTEAFLEKVVGYLGGFLLLAVGLTRWAPTVQEVHRSRDDLDRRVAERTAELKRSNDDLAHFAHAASHDLREPLRSVTSFLQLLERSQGERLDQDGRQYLNYAVAGAKSLDNLVQNLLAYARVGGDELTMSEVDTNRLVEDVRSQLSETIKDKGSILILRPGLPVITASESQLSRVFLNLISNALKFHPPERGNQVVVSAHRIQGAWEFSIADNGIGIAEEYREHVFDLFKRLHARGQYEGSGMGLAICRRIIERHGGTIRIEGEKGQGSTILFTLPDRQAS